MFDQAVVLGVEDEVDRGQPDVLVDPAVAGDKVGVEQIVVVGARRLRQEAAEAVVDVRAGDGTPDRLHDRVGAMRDVIEEGVAGAERGAMAPPGRRSDSRPHGDTGSIRRQIGHELREAVRRRG